MADYGADPCDQCGSRRFHVEEGYRVCANGHRQEVSLKCVVLKAYTNITIQGGPQIADDEEEYATLGKRTIKKKEKSTVKISRGQRLSI